MESRTLENGLDEDFVWMYKSAPGAAAVGAQKVF